LNKVEYPIDKREWHPSLIPGPIALISTYSGDREPNVAPKSWLQMAAFDPPTLMFSGSRDQTTERNILATQCFGVNFIESSMAPAVYRCVRWFGSERIERLGIGLNDASRIDAPLVADSPANLECRLRTTIEVGSGFIIFGEIEAAWMSEEILESGRDERYGAFDQAIYLEEALFASIRHVSRIERAE